MGRETTENVLEKLRNQMERPSNPVLIPRLALNVSRDLFKISAMVFLMSGGCYREETFDNYLSKILSA